MILPDYTVKPVTDVIILRVRRPLYHAALQATVLEKTRPSNGHTGLEINIDDQDENVGSQSAPHLSTKGYIRLS
jgi:hypothetical protein